MHVHDNVGVHVHVGVALSVQKHETIVVGHSLRTADVYNCSQHRTAQRMTACRSVIHTSFSPSLFSHTLLSSVSRQRNCRNYFRPRNHCGHFPRIRGLSRGPGYFGPELAVEIKKKTVGNNYGRHGTPSVDRASRTFTFWSRRHERFSHRLQTSQTHEFPSDSIALFSLHGPTVLAWCRAS